MIFSNFGKLEFDKITSKLLNRNIFVEIQIVNKILIRICRFHIVCLIKHIGINFKTNLIRKSTLTYWIYTVTSCR